MRLLLALLLVLAPCAMARQLNISWSADNWGAGEAQLVVNGNYYQQTLTFQGSSGAGTIEIPAGQFNGYFSGNYRMTAGSGSWQAVSFGGETSFQIPEGMPSIAVHWHYNGSQFEVSWSGTVYEVSPRYSGCASVSNPNPLNTLYALYRHTAAGNELIETRWVCPGQEWSSCITNATVPFTLFMMSVDREEFYQGYGYQTNNLSTNVVQAMSSGLSAKTNDLASVYAGVPPSALAGSNAVMVARQSANAQLEQANAAQQQQHEDMTKLIAAQTFLGALGTNSELSNLALEAIRTNTGALGALTNSLAQPATNAVGTNMFGGGSLSNGIASLVTRPTVGSKAPVIRAPFGSLGVDGLADYELPLSDAKFSGVVPVFRGFLLFLASVGFVLMSLRMLDKIRPS